MRLWFDQAKGNLREIISHIGAGDPLAARRMNGRIERLAALLPSQPYMGRVRAIEGTREAIPHPSYRVVYQVNDEAVHNLAVIHTRRQWPPVSED